MDKYNVELPHDVDTGWPQTISGTREQIEELRSACDNALAEGKKREVKRWDFGSIDDGLVHIYGSEGWSYANDPHHSSKGNYISTHIRRLGNLKEIVECQGPIVVGMNSRTARLAVDYFQCFSAHNTVASNLRAAVARYGGESDGRA